MPRRGKQPLHDHFLHLTLLLCSGALLLSFGFLLVGSIQALTLHLPAEAPQGVAPSELGTELTGAQALSQLPFLFEENRGQIDASVAFFASRGATRLLFRMQDLTYVLGAETLKQTFLGAGSATVVGIEKVATVSNYLLGNDPKQWHTTVPNYRGIRYEGLYPGVTLEYAATDDGGLGYRYLVDVGGKPALIELQFDGADGLTTQDNGTTLVAASSVGDLRWTGLQAYQEIHDEKIPVDIRFRVSSGMRYGFALGAYDPGFPLVIDPSLSLTYSSYLGGSGEEFNAPRVDLDSSGNIYLCGSTNSSDYPVQTAAQGTIGGGIDGYLTKLNAAGSALVYSTYLGGSGSDNCLHLAVNTSDEVAATGYVSSTNFPLVSPYQGTHGGGGNDVVVMKYDASGALVFSSYLGGSGNDFASWALFDTVGNMLFGGRTLSTNFPMASPIQAANAGADDLYISKFSPTGSSLTFSTYLGGGGADFGSSAAFDPDDNLYIVGSSASANFPMVGAAQSVNAGGSRDGILFKVNAALTSLVYSTYLGGGGLDIANGLALDPGRNLYFTGVTDSTNLPVKHAFQPVKGASRDVIVGRLSASGSEIDFLSYLGGNGAGLVEGASSGIIANSGEFVIVGRTDSTDFPIRGNAYQSTYGGGVADAFIARIAFCAGCGGAGSPRFSITSPNGFETFQSGDTVDVRWAIGAAAFETVSLFMSSDPSLPWELIASGLTHDQPYQWTVPDVEAPTQMRLRAELRDGSGAIVQSDESDYNFTVNPAPTTPPPALPEGEPAPPPPSGSTSFDPAAETAATPTITSDKQLPSNPDANCPAENLVKLPDDGDLSTWADTAVYYCGSDGKRYAFPNERVFFTWFADFDTIREIPSVTMSMIPFGGMVTFRPGVRMVKVQNDPKVYAVARGETLRWIPDEATAAALYGPDWKFLVADLDPAFFTTYTLGEPIPAAQ